MLEIIGVRLTAWEEGLVAAIMLSDSQRSLRLIDSRHRPAMEAALAALNTLPPVWSRELCLQCLSNGQLSPYQVS